MSAPPAELAAFLARTGLAGPGEEGEWTPLAGGVSSDIWKVELESGTICVKRALAQLKVAAEWKAPVERNATEWAYLQVVSEIEPGAVPGPVAQDPAAGLFAMEWLPPAQFPLWKTELMAGRVDPAFALAVGSLLGRVHAATADDARLAGQFATDDAFHSLRLEPYLLEAAARHPSVGRAVRRISQRTAETRRVLVHGDVSPKNILMGPNGPVLLDAEVAWFGDPAFDLAFCLNHLAIKHRVLPEARPALESASEALKSSYLAHVTWEDPAALEVRAAVLLPALALARVDGKSPVEYLTDDERCGLRTAALEGLRLECVTLDAAREILVR